MKEFMTCPAALADGRGKPVGNLPSGTRAVVTGASGWLGRTTCELLASAGIPTHAYASRARCCFFALDDMGEPPAGDGPLLLFHYAYLTRDKIDELGTSAYLATNTRITSHVYEWVTKFHPDAVLLASSGPASRALGIDSDPYGAQKRLDEAVFSSACARSEATLRIARIFTISGAHMTTPEIYALGSLIMDTLVGRDLLIRSGHPVFRSYISARDLALLTLLSFFDPKLPREMTFETGGEIVEIGGLADQVRCVLGREDLLVSRPTPDTDITDEYLGNDETLRTWSEEYGYELESLPSQIRTTAKGLESAVGPVGDA